MLRSLLLGVLTLTAAASCKGGEGGPAVQAGVTAGKVVEISGTVTAKRGSEARALVPGNEISGDDVIETAADSRISIVLAHNNATWSLGPNKKEKVADSMAWSLAKVDQPAKAGDESTSAAGRHAEKAGANTTATVADKGEASPADPAASPPPPPATAPPIAPPAEAPKPDSKPTGGSAPQPAKRRTAMPTRPMDMADDAAPVGARPTTGALGTSRGGGGGGGAPGLGAAPMEKRTAPPRNMAPAAEPPPPTPITERTKEAKEANHSSEIQVLADRDRAKMKACLDASTKTLAVVLEIEKGKASFELPSGTSPAVTSCLAKVAASMQPSAGLTAKLAVTIK